MSKQYIFFSLDLLSLFIITPEKRVYTIVLYIVQICRMKMVDGLKQQGWATGSWLVTLSKVCNMSLHGVAEPRGLVWGTVSYSPQNKHIIS